MASEVKFNLRFELCGLNYPDIHVHIACNSLLPPPNGLGGQI